MKLVLAAFLLLISINVFAEGPCKKDRETLCAGIEEGEGRILECLNTNEDKLSAECKAFRNEKKEQFKDIKEACHADAEKYCAGMKRKDLRKCMRSNKESLSEACKIELHEMKEKRRK